MSYLDLSSILVLLFYCLSIIATIIDILGKNISPKIKQAALTFALIALLFHSTNLFLGISSTITSRATYLLYFSWCVSLIGLVCYRYYKQILFFVFTIPFSCIIYLAFMLYRPVENPFPANYISPMFYLHISSIFLAIACMSLSFIASTLFLIQEKALKTKVAFLGFLSELPALNTLEKANSKAIFFGFPLYTLGVCLGFLWARLSWGSVFSGDPKELISIIIFVLYAILFYGKFTLAWKGKKPALWSITIFVLYAFSFIVVNNFSHHSFISLNSVLGFVG